MTDEDRSRSAETAPWSPRWWDYLLHPLRVAKHLEDDIDRILREHPELDAEAQHSDGSRAASEDKACPTCGHWLGVHNAEGCTLPTCQCTTPGGDQ